MSSYSDYYSDEVWPSIVKEEDNMTKEEKVIGAITKGPGMSPNEYQKLAMRTCAIPAVDKQGQLMHAVFGLASEAGEVSGIFQKKYQGHPINPEHLEKELGDCLWMIAEACTALDWNMEDVMRANIEKLKARYPEGFDVEHSLHRQVGDV